MERKQLGNAENQPDRLGILSSLESVCESAYRGAQYAYAYVKDAVLQGIKGVLYLSSRPCDWVCALGARQLVDWLARRGSTFGSDFLRWTIRGRAVFGLTVAVLQAAVAAGYICVPAATMAALLSLNFGWIILEVGSKTEHHASPAGQSEQFVLNTMNYAALGLNILFGHVGFFGHDSHAPTAMAEADNDLASAFRVIVPYFETTIEGQHASHARAGLGALTGASAAMVAQAAPLFLTGHGLFYAATGVCLGLYLPTFIVGVTGASLGYAVSKSWNWAFRR